MRIDSHQHFWRYDPVQFPWIGKDMGVLQRDFEPSHLQPILQETGIDFTVAVQARQTEEETRYLLELADVNEFILGVVGWVDLRADDLDERLAELAHPKLCGVRHIIHDEPKVDFMLDPAFRAGVGKLADHDLSYDLLLFPKHLGNACDLVAEHQHVRFVLDHVGKPQIRARDIDGWQRDVERLAAHRNVWCKVSGMVTEADRDRWAEIDFRAYLEVVFGAFGTDRLMFGSDWPVCLLAADYGEVLDIVTGFVKNLPEDEVDLFFGGNAASFYRLEIAH